MESWKTKDGEDNFRGPRWHMYLVHIDAAFSTLTAEPGSGGLKLLPWDSFAAHVKRLVYLAGMYEWMNESS